MILPLDNFHNNGTIIVAGGGSALLVHITYKIFHYPTIIVTSIKRNTQLVIAGMLSSPGIPANLSTIPWIGLIHLSPINTTQTLSQSNNMRLFTSQTIFRAQKTIMNLVPINSMPIPTSTWCAMCWIGNTCVTLWGTWVTWFLRF